MTKMSLSTLLTAAGIAAFSAASGLSVKVFNWAATNHHKTHCSAVQAVLEGLSPQSREQLMWALVILTLAAFTVFGLGLYRFLKEKVQSTSPSPGIYRLFPLLAFATIVSTQVVVSLATLLGSTGYQGFGILTNVMVTFFFLAVASTASPLVLAGKGRCHPTLWRMSAMAAVLAFPCFSVGGTLALLPWRLVLVGH